MLLNLKKLSVTGAVLGAVAAAVSAAPAALAAPEVKQLADDVYMMSESYYTSLVVVGDEGVLITDPAFTSRAESMKAAIAGITDKPVTTIVLSHEHYDHAGGTGVFPDAQVICHSACQAVFDLDVIGQAPGKVHQSFDDFLHVDFAGTTVNLHYYGPADGFGSAVVHLPEERVAFTADIYAERALTNGMWMEDDNYLAIRKMLKALQEMDLAHAVSGHSFNTSPEIVDENAAFVEDLFDLVLAEVRKAMQAGGQVQVFRSLSRWPHELKLPQYADWQGYNEFLPAHVRRMALSIFHGG